jgi:NADPH:quinone reductase-like Zn-dependent oxidoreductase
MPPNPASEWTGQQLRGWLPSMLHASATARRVQEIAQDVAAGRLKAKPARVFGFEEIREAHRIMEAGEADGKMVVVRG